MDERSGRGVMHAMRDGLARAASAPAILAGTLTLALLLARQGTLDPYVFIGQYLAVLALSPFGELLALSEFGVSPHAPHAIVSLVVWSFLVGGILDRFARNRPTRGRGFFGACGAHLPAMLRLAIVEWVVLFESPLVGLRQLTYGREVFGVVLLAVAALFLYARVRLVVEDRRSAFGAVLAGGRFIRRNPAAVPMFLVFAAAVWFANWLWAAAAPAQGDAGFLATVTAELLVTFLLFVVFSSWAAAIALFQSRLAHASYTAGPPLEWPESPAAEAISNLSPSPPHELPAVQERTHPRRR